MTLRDHLLPLIESDTRSQTALARDAGIPQPTISAFVTGERGAEPRAEFVARLGRALGLSPAALGRLLLDSYPAEKKGEK